MELVQVDPIATPDEIASTQLPNIADGLDSVTAHFGWRPSAPSTWVSEHWKKRIK